MNSRTKKILAGICIVLLLILLAWLLRSCGKEQETPTPPPVPTPYTTDYGEPLPEDVRRIDFRYECGGEFPAHCFYTDRYFQASGYEYNPSLATMSVCFAMSAFASFGSDGQAANAKALLTEIGMAPSDIAWNNWFNTRPEMDSIGVIVGSKPLAVDGKDYTLLALAVRGSGYGREWASNFTIGETGQHSGFQTASENALNFLREYIRKHQITGDVKLWVTGFSRAAATANLIAGAVDQGADLGEGVSCVPEDLYAYCFEAPAGALAEDVRGHSEYYNIFNIINQSDPVPYVAPSALGFGRYGMDRYLPSAQSSSGYSGERQAMLDQYKALGAVEEYIVDNFQMKKVQVQNLLPGGNSPVQDDSRKNYSQGVFLSNYVTILSKDFIKSREYYVRAYEPGIREICYVVFGSTGEQQEKLAAGLKDRIVSGWPELLRRALDLSRSRSDVFALVSDWLVSSVQEAGIEEYHEDALRQAGTALTDLLVSLVVSHPNYATTLAVNIKGVGEAHKPELCLAWLASMDPYYAAESAVSFNDGSFRILRINSAGTVTGDTTVAADQSALPDGESASGAGTGTGTQTGTDGESPSGTGSGMLSGVMSAAKSLASLFSGGGQEDSAEDLNDDRPDLTNTAAPGIAIQVFDEEDALLASIENGVPQEVEDSSVISAINDDEEIIIILPPDAAYRVEVSGVKTGGVEEEASVSYGVSEYSADVGEVTRSVDFFDVPMTDDTVLTGSIPAYSEHELENGAPDGSTAEYTLFRSDSGAVDSNSDLTGSDMSESYYTVTAAASRSEWGVVSGGGLRQYGSYAEVEAAPQDGFVFEAWYQGRTLVSTEPVYRFCVTEDTALTARFAREGHPDPFRDVSPEMYCYDAVLWAAREGVAGGVTADTFAPWDLCTGAQVVTFLWRTAGSPEPETEESPFADLNPASYYYKAVLWAWEQGITLGTTTDTFSPNRTITRAQVVTLLSRAAKATPSVTDSPFEDIPDDAYYHDAVSWAAETGVTRGTSPVTFTPAGRCNRGQIVTFLYRHFGQIQEEKEGEA